MFKAVRFCKVVAWGLASASRQFCLGVADFHGFLSPPAFQPCYASQTLCLYVERDFGVKETTTRLLIFCFGSLYRVLFILIHAIMSLDQELSFTSGCKIPAPVISTNFLRAVVP